MENSFDSLPMDLAGILKKLRKCQNGKGDVGVSGHGSIHEAAYSFTIRSLLHCSISVALDGELAFLSVKLGEIGLESGSALLSNSQASIVLMYVV